MVQWLGVGAFTTVAWVQSLIGKLRFHKPRMQSGQDGKKKIGNEDLFESCIHSKLEFHAF